MKKIISLVTVIAMAALMLAGCGAGMIYQLLAPKNQYVAVIAAAVVCPLINTGIFLVGCVLFFMDLIAEWAMGLGFGENVVQYMFVGLAGGNFLFELLFNIVLSPVIVRLLKIKKV